MSKIKEKALAAGFSEEVLEESLDYLVELAENGYHSSLAEESESCFNYETFELHEDMVEYSNLIDWVAQQF